MILLDTNIVIYAAQADFAYLRPLVQYRQNAVSAITHLEVLGFPRLTVADKLYFENVFALLQTFDITPDIIEKAILLRQSRKMTVGDAIVAATALLYDWELYTRNLADFVSIPDIKLYNPVR
jgi:toxin FitB